MIQLGKLLTDEEKNKVFIFLKGNETLIKPVTEITIGELKNLGLILIPLQHHKNMPKINLTAEAIIILTNRAKEINVSIFDEFSPYKYKLIQFNKFDKDEPGTIILEENTTVKLVDKIFDIGLKESVFEIQRTGPGTMGVILRIGNYINKIKP
jgi:hypothetical protein